MELSHELMIVATMFLEKNCARRIKIDGKENYCCVPVFKKAHYDK